MQVIGTYADVCLLMRERMLTLPAKRASVLLIGCNDEGTYFFFNYFSLMFPPLLFQVIGCNDENREPIKLTAKGLTVRFFYFVISLFRPSAFRRFIICFLPFFDSFFLFIFPSFCFRSMHTLSRRLPSSRSKLTAASACSSTLSPMRCSQSSKAHDA